MSVTLRFDVGDRPRDDEYLAFVGAARWTPSLEGIAAAAVRLRQATDQNKRKGLSG